MHSLLRHGARVAAALPGPTPDSEVVFAFGTDRAAFAAALLGTWAAGHAAALPATAQRELVVPLLARPASVAFLHDTGVGRGIDVPRLLAEPDPGGPAAIPVTPPPGHALRTWDWDERGELTSTAWTGEQLLREVDRLAARLSWRPGMTVASTLAPTCLLGVLGSLLLPLWRGGRPALPGEPAQVLLTSRFHRHEAGTAGSMPPTVVCSEDLDGAPPAALAEWTAQVAAIPGVEDAAAILAGADLFAAVVAPGLDEARLRESMARSGQRLPARLRLVAALPRDGNGRLPAPAVYRMFGLGPRGLPRSRELEWSPEVVAQADGGHRFAVRVPRDYACFDGHFPGYPVLAGAVQLAELILPCLRRLHPEAGRVAHWSGIKFQARIAPGDDLSVVLLPASKPGQLHFAVWRDERKCSSGRLSW